jgi:hypothetical protein
MADVINRSGAKAEAIEQIGLVVLAPKKQIGARVFGRLCEADSIAAKVLERVRSYGPDKIEWHARAFLPLLGRIHVSLLSWEDVLSTVQEHDADAASVLTAFYSSCLRFGRSDSGSLGGA